MSTAAESSASEYDYDDDDGAEYKMPSMGSLPHETPSRDTFLGLSDDSAVSLASPDPSLPRKTVTRPPPPPPSPSRTEGSPASLPPFQTPPPAAALVTPEQQQHGLHHRGRVPPPQEAALHNSHASLDIAVIPREGADLGGRPTARNNRHQYDINYASTDTFPTSNVFQSQQPRGSPSGASPPQAGPSQPPFSAPPSGRFRLSTGTVPVSNITTRPSTVTEGSATASDITATTGGGPSAPPTRSSRTCTMTAGAATTPPATTTTMTTTTTTGSSPSCCIR